MKHKQTAKHKKQVKKEHANSKRQAIIVVDSREPKEIIDKLKETEAEVIVLDNLEVVEEPFKPDTKPMSPARRAFQNM